MADECATATSRDGTGKAFAKRRFPYARLPDDHDQASMPEHGCFKCLLQVFQFLLAANKGPGLFVDARSLRGRGV